MAAAPGWSLFAAHLDAAALLDAHDAVTAFDVDFTDAPANFVLVSAAFRVRLRHADPSKVRVWAALAGREFLLWSGDSLGSGTPAISVDAVGDAWLNIGRLFDTDLSGLPLRGRWSLFVSLPEGVALLEDVSIHALAHVSRAAAGSTIPFGPAANLTNGDASAIRTYLRTEANGGTEVSTPTIGQSVYFHLDWQLSGTGTAATITNRAVLDGTTMCSGSVSASPGTSWVAWCTSPWTTTAGTHTLRWDLDYLNSVAETNETNNSATKTFTPTSAVDIAATRAYLRSAANGGTEVTTLSIGQTVYFHLDWQVTGTGSAVSVTNRAVFDGTTMCSGSVSASPGTSWVAWCPTAWTATAGTHTLRWDLDYLSSLAEANESNNSASTTFMVAAPTSFNKVGPANNALNQPLNLTLSWSASSVMGALAAAGAGTARTGVTIPGSQVILRASPFDSFTRAGVNDGRARQVASLGATINVTYNGFTPEAQAAFQHAVNIWASQISSPVPIEVVANWAPLDPGVLGSAGPSVVSRDFAGAPLSGVYYPIALANRLAGLDLVPSVSDIDANFNSTFDFYFGTDGNPPAGQYDLVSVILHELGHGLGFVGSASVSGSQGSWGLSGFPFVYDKSVVDGSGQSILDTTLFPNPSTALGSELRSNNLFWNGPSGIIANGGVRPKLYAPATWSQGSSYSHLDEATYAAGDINSLMTPQIGSAEAIHSPGPITLGIFDDSGWSTGQTNLMYAYCYDTSNDNNCTNWISTGSATSVALSGLNPNTQYYWHVRATNAGGTTYSDGSASAFWTFTTMGPPPPFNKVSPTNGSTGQSTSPTLTWGASAGATYQYCYDTVNNSSCDDSWRSAGGATSAGLTGLTPNTTYYWQVRATNAIGTTYANGSLSAFWSFRTLIPGDSYEVDDISAQGSLLTAGASQTHTIHVPSDVDWVRFTASAGRQFILSTSAVVDTVMCLYASNAVTLVTCDNDGGRYPHSRIVYTPPVSGTYYVEVHSYNNSSTGSYQLTLQLTPRPLLFLNGDNAADVFAYQSSSGIWARLQTMPGGGFSETNGAWNPGWSVLSANFNSDGLTDLFLSNATTGRWFKMLNTGSDFTVQATDYWWPNWQKFVMDLDGDGISDLFLYDPASGVWYKAISTPTGFNYFSSSWLPGWEITPVNLNGDAYGDMFLYSRTDGRWFWVLGQGGGDFSYPQTSSWLKTWRISVGDFNGDGLSDLHLLDPASGRYFTCLNTGTGFDYFEGYWIPGWSPTVADLDGDGADDLFLYSNSTGRWFEVISNKQGQFIDTASDYWIPGWNIYPTDFNGDGWTDLLLYNPTTGRSFQVWNYGIGNFGYVDGYWLTGLTIVVGAWPR